MFLLAGMSPCHHEHLGTRLTEESDAKSTHESNPPVYLACNGGWGWGVIFGTFPRPSGEGDQPDVSPLRMNESTGAYAAGRRPCTQAKVATGGGAAQPHSGER